MATPSTSRNGLGHVHQATRRRLAPLVAAGLVNCARCGKPIRPGEPWDLDHTDDRQSYLGPSHRRCNRATAKPRPRPADPDEALLEDDPANGIYWSPPDDVTGKQTRWSRVWFEWRDK